MSDVAELIAAWQASLPGSAWQSDAITPDTAALGKWMQQQSDTSGGLKLTRSADPFDRAVRYLELEGVDVGRALERAGDAREAGASRARADADDIEGLAISLKRAERAHLAEARGFNEGAAGFTAARLGEARERAARLESALLEACGHDRSLARQARRAVA